MKIVKAFLHYQICIHELKRSNPQLLLLAQLIAQNPHSHLLHLPANASLILDSPLAYNLSKPLFVLQLHCSHVGDDALQEWIPLLIYPTSAFEFYLIVRLRPFDLNACTLTQCSNTKFGYLPSTITNSLSDAMQVQENKREEKRNVLHVNMLLRVKMNQLLNQHANQPKVMMIAMSIIGLN
uniref:Uncharacterized protein n=1 Tax=Elaeophora elaphi TaxID=1147741 RepID=A0A158Q821_9BILA